MKVPLAFLLPFVFASCVNEDYDLERLDLDSVICPGVSIPLDYVLHVDGASLDRKVKLVNPGDTIVMALNKTLTISDIPEIVDVSRTDFDIEFSYSNDFPLQFKLEVEPQGYEVVNEPVIANTSFVLSHITEFKSRIGVVRSIKVSPKLVIVNNNDFPVAFDTSMSLDISAENVRFRNGVYIDL